MAKVTEKVLVSTVDDLVAYLTKYCNPEDTLSVGLSDDIVLVKNQDDCDNVNIAIMEPCCVAVFDHFDDFEEDQE